MDTDLPRFEHVIVDDAPPCHLHCKGAGDLDGDGCVDLVVGSASGDGLHWYRSPQWKRRRIAPGSYTTDLTVADADGDGHLDVIVPRDGALTVFRNPGPGRIDEDDGWELVQVGDEGAHDVKAADLTGDGRLDLVTRYQSGFGHRMGDAIHLWVQAGPLVWEHRSFACPHGEGLEVADVNGDGRPDVIIGGRWYENPGDALEGEWQEHRYIGDADFAAHWTDGDVAIAAGDLTGDGRTAIALAPAEGAGRLAWYEAPVGAAGPWTEHLLEAETDHTHALEMGDMTGDGRLDLVGAKMHQASAPQDVFVWHNRGAGPWVRQAVAGSGSHNIRLVDVGQTGRLDVYGANWNSHSPTGGRVELWLNRG